MLQSPWPEPGKSVKSGYPLVSTFFRNGPFPFRVKICSDHGAIKFELSVGRYIIEYPKHLLMKYLSTQDDGKGRTSSGAPILPNIRWATRASSSR